MREIKFDYIFEDLIDNEIKHIKYSMDEIENNCLKGLINNKYVKWIARRQYAGIKDKNGVEIYEGDIVVQDGYKWFVDSIPNYVGTVELIYSQWQVVAHSVSDNNRGSSNGINEGLNDSGIADNDNSEWIIIGNIYEHPHLLGT